jgi:hypothetical protein
LTDSQSKNALTHGLYASDVVLAWENQQDFEALLQAYRDEYGPDGVLEEAAVFDLASLHWKKRRLNLGSQLAFHMQPEAKAIAAAGKNGWQGVADYLATGQGDCLADVVRAAAKSQSEVAAQVCNELAERAERMKPDDATVGSEQSEVVEFEKLVALANQLNIAVKDVVQLLRTTEELKLDQKVADQVYRPDIMEKELKLHAEIDRRIEKAMRRLVQAKEYKKLYGAKSINLKQDGITSLPTNLPLRI